MQGHLTGHALVGGNPRYSSLPVLATILTHATQGTREDWARQVQVSPDALQTKLDGKDFSVHRLEQIFYNLHFAVLGPIS
jgi:hypothetical protein